MHLKDDVLAELSRTHNVAQFVSFAAGASPRVRHSALRGMSPISENATIESAIAKVHANSQGGSVNVRSFKPAQPSGNPFHYGLSDLAQVAQLVRSLASDGYYTIVNETIDVEDGGISGVYQGGIIEFAPGDTPRAVEGSDAAALPADIGLPLLERVYGCSIDLGTTTDRRLEFSVHPLRVGANGEHVVIWEASVAPEVELQTDISWPNQFSRLIGDKAFGLMIADLLGFRVPATTVIPRSVAPFAFGTKTGSGETWLRTAPRDRSPGTFTTTRGWTDPFRLLQHEDPTEALASVLAQEGLNALFSGAAIPQSSGVPLIEGVHGFGDDFMLGTVEPESLPERVTADVTAIWRDLTAAIGDVSFEWVHDGSHAWVMQLHRFAITMSEGEIVAGEPENGWLSYVAGTGLDQLRELVREARVRGMGVEVVGHVGLTSHVGDLLRQSGVPARQGDHVRAYA